MKFETELVRGQNFLSDTEDLPANVVRLRPTVSARKDLRDAVTFTTDDALAVQRDMLSVANGLSATMISVAGIVNEFKVDPGVDDLVNAASRLLQAAHSIMDRGLMIPNWDEARCGAVMIELVARGTFAALGIPYEEVLKSVWASGDAYFVLKQNGLIKGESDEQQTESQGATDATVGGSLGCSGLGGVSGSDSAD